MSHAKFAVGQVVLWKRWHKKHTIALTIVEVMEAQGDIFYRGDRRHWIAQELLRPLTAAEKGEPGTLS